MPTDFWRNDQMLNIFRTKPCQRLARDGVCGWRSQCQFSHTLEWPRRQPRRYNYSCELCPNVVVTEGPDGTERLENNCTAGLRCPWAHSKEEVLFHPHIFKTTLCEEHTSNTGTDKNQRQTRNAKKNRCHRYYCPFAHGVDELRTSTLSAEQRDKCLRSMEAFPSDVCCMVCTRHWVTPTVAAQKFPEAPGLTLLESPAPTPMWPRPQKAPQGLIGTPAQNPWDVLATVPNQTLTQDDEMLFRDTKDIFASKMQGQTRRDQSKTVPSPIQKPSADPLPYDPFPAPFKPQGLGPFYGDIFSNPYAGAMGLPLGVHDLRPVRTGSPAFIDLTSTKTVMVDFMKMSRKQRQWTRSTLPCCEDTLRGIS